MRADDERRVRGRALSARSSGRPSSRTDAAGGDRDELPGPAAAAEPAFLVGQVRLGEADVAIRRAADPDRAAARGRRRGPGPTHRPGCADMRIPASWERLLRETRRPARPDRAGVGRRAYPRSTNRSVPPASQRFQAPPTALAARATEVEFDGPVDGGEQSKPRRRADQAVSERTVGRPHPPHRPRQPRQAPQGPDRQQPQPDEPRLDPPLQEAAHRRRRRRVLRLVIGEDRGERPQAGPQDGEVAGRSAARRPRPAPTRGRLRARPAGARPSSVPSASPAAAPPPSASDRQRASARPPTTSGPTASAPGRPTTTRASPNARLYTGPASSPTSPRWPAASRRPGPPGSPAPTAPASPPAAPGSRAGRPTGAISARASGRRDRRRAPGTPPAPPSGVPIRNGRSATARAQSGCPSRAGPERPEDRRPRPRRAGRPSSAPRPSCPAR